MRKPRVRPLFPICLTPHEVAAVTGLTSTAVREAITSGRLPAYRAKPRNPKSRQLCIVSDVVDFIRRELERV